MAAIAPVASCGVVEVAKEDDELEVADEAEAEGEPEPLAAELEAAAVAEEALAEEELEPELLESADVAFRVPHTSSFLQVLWPSASLG